MRFPERVSVVAALPPHGSWRRALALERGGGEPRAVVLSYVPPEVIDEPARLAALVRDVEVAGRLHHPCAVPVLGTDTAGDALAIVEAFRPGETLRALLDAAGRLPPEIAARVVADACAAIASAHAIDGGEGQPLVHGAVSPERIAIGHDGAALVSGFGAGGGGRLDADVRALAAVLHECLAGEPPGAEEGSLALPGIPPALAEVVARVLRGEPSSAEELGRAIAGAVPLAAHAEVMAYSEAILPADRGERSRPEEEDLPSAEAREDSGEDVRFDAADPGRRAPAPEPPSTAAGADAARVFAAPPPPAPRSRLPLVVAACALVGFAAGFVAARGGLGRPAPPAPVPAEAAHAGPSALASAPQQEASPAPAPQPVTPQRVTPAPEPRRPSAPARPAVRTAKKDAASTATRGAAPVRRAAAAPAGKGILSVTAPDEAEVFLDGRAVGRGSLRRDVPAGAHEIEVRLGEARVAERFEVAPGETWTYEVTPTP